MNGHIEEGSLQAWADGELPPAEAGAVEAHLERCPLCRDTLKELESLGGEVSRAVALLDPPVPDLESALWEVRRRRARRRTSGHRRGMAAAAVIVLFLGAGAAAALPGSPIRGWIEGRFAADPVPSALEAVDEEAPGSTLGVTVDLLNGAIDVAFTGVPRGMTLEVEPVAEGRAGVYAPPASRFRTAPGRVEVSVMGPGEVLRVRVPEGAARAEIRVNDEVVARVVAGDLLLPGAGASRVLEDRIRVRVNPGDLPPSEP